VRLLGDGSGIGVGMRELLQESTLLALMMTLPPIAVLALIELLTEADVTLLVYWTIFAFSWTLAVALFYYKTHSINGGGGRLELHRLF